MNEYLFLAALLGVATLAMLGVIAEGIAKHREPRTTTITITIDVTKFRAAIALITASTEEATTAMRAFAEVTAKAGRGPSRRSPQEVPDA